MGRQLRFSRIESGPEMERIRALPRRPIPDPHSTYAKELAAWMTRRMARVPNPYPGPFFPTQALAIKELLETGKLAAPIAAGYGKTLLAYALFAAKRAQRPMYLAPKSMLKETREECIKFSADWHGPPASRITFLSYQTLSSPKSAAHIRDGQVVRGSILDRFNPDVILGDEGHLLGNSGSIGASRMEDFLRANPSAIYIPLTGTIVRDSICQGAHLLRWALGSGPLPDDFDERTQWASYLDEKSGWGARSEMGDLRLLFNEAELKMLVETPDPDDQRALACAVVGRWILETPGVIGSQDGPLGIPLDITERQVQKPDPVIEREMQLLIDGDPKNKRGKWVTPDGVPLIDAFALARVRRTYAMGFYTIQEPDPGQEYRERRKAWAKAARDRLAHNKLRIDSEANLKAAIAEGHFRDLREPLQAWMDAQRDYTARTGRKEPPTVAKWFSDEVLNECAAWMAEVGTGIIWVEDIDLGNRLAAHLGCSFFRDKKRDADGRHVNDLGRGEPAVLSVFSCGTGTNGLQRVHHRALWLTAPHEQPLARLHRHGQPAERVQYDIYLPGRVQLERYWTRYRKATQFAAPITRQHQRIAYAHTRMPHLEECSPVLYRWKRTKKTAEGDE